jgi:putative ABC transport system substrate-binding protein
MRRRDFITAVGGTVLLSPLDAHAQAANVVRVGFVYPGNKAAATPRLEAMLTGLRVSGYAAPAQIELVLRLADGDPAQIKPLVEEVLASKVDVFIANGPAVLHVAREITKTVPIVAIDFETDPVASGVAVSLSRPGGNVTGIFLDFPDFSAKWLELLVESNAQLAYIAVLWDPVTGPLQVEAVKKAAGSMNIQLEVLEVRQPSDFEGAFAAAAQRSVGAMILLSSPVISPNVHRLAELALRHRLAAITLFPDFARAGGLLAYGPNLLGQFRLLGVMGAKVLRGNSPADLPIERPTKFELVLNLRTANALGLSLAPGLLLRADEVIE